MPQNIALIPNPRVNLLIPLKKKTSTNIIGFPPLLMFLQMTAIVPPFTVLIFSVNFERCQGTVYLIQVFIRHQKANLGDMLSWIVFKKQRRQACDEP